MATLTLIGVVSLVTVMGPSFSLVFMEADYGAL
jgi:hypothetical protein